MIYNTISSKVVIGRVFDRFNVNYSGFLPRVPNWINSALRQLEMYPTLTDDIQDGTVVDFKCAIPSETAVLNGVSYLGKLLPRIPRINESDASRMSDLWHRDYKYQLDKKGYIITSFEEGDIKFYIQKYPTELDAVTKLYFPLIPENETFLDALDHYILFRCLQRNHKIAPYSLLSNNIYINPGLYWDSKQLAVRNELAAFDPEERKEISDQIRTFLTKENYRSEVLFNPYNKQ